MGPDSETPERAGHGEKVMTSELVERLHEQNYSNRLDSGEHKWADLVSLLEIAKSDDDLEYVTRRLKRGGFNAVADIKREMIAAISAQISTLSNLITEIARA